MEVASQIFLYQPLCLVNFSSQPQAKRRKKKLCLLPVWLMEKTEVKQLIWNKIIFIISALTDKF